MRRAALYLQAVGLEPSAPRLEAVTGLSELLQEAFEEVRVLSEASREWSQGVRGESAALRAHSRQLMERGHTLMEDMAQWASPSPSRPCQRAHQSAGTTPPQASGIRASAPATPLAVHRVPRNTP